MHHSFNYTRNDTIATTTTITTTTTVTTTLNTTTTTTVVTTAIVPLQYFPSFQWYTFVTHVGQLVKNWKNYVKNDEIKDLITMFTLTFKIRV